jgi:hypothetical protein
MTFLAVVTIMGGAVIIAAMVLLSTCILSSRISRREEQEIWLAAFEHEGDELR